MCTDIRESLEEEAVDAVTRREVAIPRQVKEEVVSPTTPGDQLTTSPLTTLTITTILTIIQVELTTPHTSLLQMLRHF